MLQFLFLLLFSVSTFAADLNPKFTYQTQDGETTIACASEKLADLPDYRVHCGDASSQKDYSVHFLVHQYEAQQSPFSMFEILYWVVETHSNGNNVARSQSSTVWIRLKQKTDLDGMIFTQSIENDSALLRLELSL